MPRHIVVQEYTNENRDRYQDTVWKLHEGCDECAEPEAFDDDGPEIGDSTVRDVAHDTEQEEAVDFRIFERFDDLVTLEMLVLHTSLVLSQPLDCPSSLFWSQQGRCDRRIREEEEEHYTPNCT